MEVVLSPNIHRYPTEPIELLIKVTVNGAVQEVVLLAVKIAFGFGKTTTDFVTESLHAPKSVTIFTRYVPGLGYVMLYVELLETVPFPKFHFVPTKLDGLEIFVAVNDCPTQTVSGTFIMALTKPILTALGLVKVSAQPKLFFTIKEMV